MLCCAAFVMATLVSRAQAQAAPTRDALKQALAELSTLVDQAKAKNLPVLYAEATLVTGNRLVGDQWDKMQDAKRRDDCAVYLARQVAHEKDMLQKALAGQKDPREVPPIPDYAKLTYTPKKPYLTLDGTPVLVITAGNSGGGKADPRYVGPGDLYGLISAVGATRYDYDSTPIWPLYQADPKSHRVYDGGWCGHIIKDKWSIGGAGGKEGTCIISLDYPPMREAVKQAVLQKCQRYAQRKNPRHKILTMDWEFTYMNYDESTLKLWQQWLEKRYNKIAELNKLWKTDLKSFADVTLPPIQSEREENPAKYYDYGEFNLWRFTDYLLWAKKVISDEVPGLPMCVGGGQPFGVDFWKQGVDEEFLGVTGVCDVWLSETGSRSWGTPSFMDLQTSVAPEKLIMDPEYHASGAYVPLMFFHGCGTLDVYGWKEKEEQSFAHGSAMLRGALDVRRLAPYIIAFAKTPPEAAILYSRGSLIQRHPGGLQMQGRGVQTPYILELEKCYRAGNVSDTAMGFVTSRMAKEGVDPKLKAVLVTGAYFAGKDEVKGLMDYANKGGSLVITPTSMVADEYNRRVDYLKDLGIEIVKETVPKYLAGKARAGVERPGSEYDFIQGPIAPTVVEDEPQAKLDAKKMNLDTLNGRGIRQQIKVSGQADVLATFDDGSPAIVAKKTGRGEVIYLAMQLDEPDMRRFVNWLYDRVGIARPVRVTAPDGSMLAGVESRTIPYQQGYITYLFNLTDDGMTAKLVPSKGVQVSKVENLTAGTAMKPTDTLPLGPYECVVLKLEK
jgi:hypothetical protein